MDRKGKMVRVAVAGRRNVGKSTLFNALLGRQRAITDSFAGLTRDILEEHVTRGETDFYISDTPGLDLEEVGDLETAIVELARAHLNGMDLVLLLLEAPALQGFDHFLVDFLRHNVKARVIYVVNKVDNPKNAEDLLAEFYSEGLDPVVPISARGRWNLNALLEAMAEAAPQIKRKAPASQSRTDESDDEQSDEEIVEHTEADERAMQSDEEDDESSGAESDESETVEKEPVSKDFAMAIVGRPNSGKSSIFNRLIERDVSLVSDVPGTTRDTVDTVLRYFGRSIRIIDTAGLRRATHLHGKENRVDFFSAARTRRAIKAADICVHVIDAAHGITDLDKKISDLITQSGKPVILALNKWDTVPEKDTHTMKEYMDKLEFLFPYASNFPSIFCSALTGQRVKQILETACELIGKIHFRVPTHQLNELVAKWNRRLPGGFSGKILFVTQSEAFPPQFVFFVSGRMGMRESFVNFFENRLRDTFDLEGIPIRIEVRDRSSKKKERK
ncbi:MAG: ribosome biogenesis GTPase Der [Spirochaetia bacterium]|nr:ribosome biogenesis GTPase Der [Spirochaetia bacterium]